MIFWRLFFGWLIQIGPFALLCIQPFAGQLRFPLRKTGAVMLILFAGLAAAFALTGCALHRASASDPWLFVKVNMAFFVSLIFCFLWYLYAVTASWPKKLFVFSYVLSGAFIITSISNAIATRLHMGRSDGLPYLGCAPLILLLAAAAFLPVLFFVLKRHYQIMADSFTNRESIYISTLSIVLCVALSSGLICFGYLNLYEPMNLLLYIALLISIFAMHGICFKLLDITHEKMSAQRKYDELHCQLSLQVEQYRRISNNMEATRRMRHDLKHHMITIQGFLQGGNVKEAEQYLDHYLLVTKELEIPKLCDNAVVNTIAIPADLAVQDIDLSVLIGNLLENAFDAALLVEGEARFIRFNMACFRKMLAVTVDNGFNGTVKMEAGRYLSTKDQHSGFGLASVEAIAEKYSGGVEFTHEAEVFHSSVMLGI